MLQLLLLVVVVFLLLLLLLLLLVVVCVCVRVCAGMVAGRLGVLLLLLDPPLLAGEAVLALAVGLLAADLARAFTRSSADQTKVRARAGKQVRGADLLVRATRGLERGEARRDLLRKILLGRARVNT